MAYILRTFLPTILLAFLAMPAAAQLEGPGDEAVEPAHRSSIVEALSPAPPASWLAADLQPTGNGLQERLEAALDLEAPFLQQDPDRRTNLSLIAAGATLLVAGSFIDGSAGTVVMVTGSIFSAVGVYRWVR